MTVIEASRVCRPVSHTCPLLRKPVYQGFDLTDARWVIDAGIILYQKSSGIELSRDRTKIYMTKLVGRIASILASQSMTRPIPSP